jgi:histidyl-tRNA synthetase
VIVGSKEIEAGTCMVKNLLKSTQVEIKASELVQRLIERDPSL